MAIGVMLNTMRLGGEGVPFFCIVSCSIAEKNIREWYFVGITEEEDFVVAVQAIVSKDNSTMNSHSFVCAFYN